MEPEMKRKFAIISAMAYAVAFVVFQITALYITRRGNAAIVEIWSWVFLPGVAYGVRRAAEPSQKHCRNR